MKEYNNDNTDKSNSKTSYKIKNFLKLLCTGEIISRRSVLHETDKLICIVVYAAIEVENHGNIYGFVVTIQIDQIIKEATDWLNKDLYKKFPRHDFKLYDFEVSCYLKQESRIFSKSVSTKLYKG